MLESGEESSHIVIQHIKLGWAKVHYLLFCSMEHWSQNYYYLKSEYNGIALCSCSLRVRKKYNIQEKKKILQIYIHTYFQFTFTPNYNVGVSQQKCTQSLIPSTQEVFTWYQSQSRGSQGRLPVLKGLKIL